MIANAFKDEDLKQAKALEDLILTKATWNLSTPELVKAYQALVWYSNLKDKISSNIVEDIKVTEPKAAKSKT